MHVRRILTRDFTMGVADGEVWLGEQQVYRADNLKVALFRQEPAQVQTATPLLECV
ncbi:MAG TPA: hypothetical protein VM553_08460 [Dongiaceae bacterium]|nr:hypothetical protein [Dongiaceae bacterium]